MRHVVLEVFFKWFHPVNCVYVVMSGTAELFCTVGAVGRELDGLQWAGLWHPQPGSD